MKKIISMLIVAFMISSLFLSCSIPYDVDWIIGKASNEIEEKYGSFDIIMSDAVDGIYKSTGCGYLTNEGKTGFFGTSPDEFFMIFFDENGIAYKTEKDFPRPGG